MFTDRFNLNPTASRPDVSFRSRIANTADIKDDWGFLWDDALKSNVAAALQGVHFDILLCNEYNVYYSPLWMKYKGALVQIASVVELVLQFMVKMVEDDPRVRKVLGSSWTFIDFRAVPLPGIEIPSGQRSVVGLQREVQHSLDRNTKMQMLIKAAKAADIVDKPMSEKLDGLRQWRNRVHIKELNEPEYAHYKPKLVNDALDTLEEFRRVALRWTVAQRAAQAVETPASVLHERAVTAVTPQFRTGEVVAHGDLGLATVHELRSDGSVVIQLSGDKSLWAVSPEALTGFVGVLEDEIQF